MYYINWKQSGQVETIDQADTYKEAKFLLSEYILAYGGGYIYISSRSTKEWREGVN